MQKVRLGSKTSFEKLHLPVRILCKVFVQSSNRIKQLFSSPSLIAETKLINEKKFDRDLNGSSRQLEWIDETKYIYIRSSTKVELEYEKRGGSRRRFNAISSANRSALSTRSALILRASIKLHPLEKSRSTFHRNLALRFIEKKKKKSTLETPFPLLPRVFSPSFRGSDNNSVRKLESHPFERSFTRPIFDNIISRIMIF